MKNFAAGTTVKVVKADFAGRIGVVLDQKSARDQRGDLLPPTRPGSGYYWVMVSLNGKSLPAHLFWEEIEVLAREPAPQFDGS